MISVPLWQRLRSFLEIMIKVIHIITDLDTGGAEMMLFNLVSRMDRRLFHNEIISLADIGVVGKELQKAGISVYGLGLNRNKISSSVHLGSLVCLLKEIKPEIIQTWLYHADLVGGIAARLAGNVPVIWGIRHSDLSLAGLKKRTRFVVRLCSGLSRTIPVKIICNSQASRLAHIKFGYDKHKIAVIPNGIDLARFKPDETARASVRQELGLSSDTLLVGLIARFDPLKDQHNFIQAAGLFHKTSPDTHFVLCGKDINPQNQTLVRWINTAGIKENCHLLDLRHDIARIISAMDIVTSSSYSESWTTVIGEAMACGVPCVATDVGDSALIIGDTGKIVPPRNPKELANGWQEIINLGESQRMRLGLSARRRISEHFNITAIVRQYQSLYQDMI